MRFSTKMNEYNDKQWKKELKPYYMGIRKLNKIQENWITILDDVHQRMNKEYIYILCSFSFIIFKRERIMLLLLI